MLETAIATPAPARVVVPADWWRGYREAYGSAFPTPDDDAAFLVAFDELARKRGL